MLRVLAVSSGVAVFLTLFGPFGDVRALGIRAAEYFAFAWSGSLLGLTAVRLLFRVGFPYYRNVLALGLATGLVMAPPMSVVVWTGVSLANGHILPLSALPEVLWDTVLVCIGASMIAVLANRRLPAAAEAAPTPPKFLERLPLKLRGAEVWAVEAEDHYLRLHTSKGQDLILMRLSDAARELDGIEGMQVHRSWWVARDAIADARRGDGRATLTLKDGSQVPVSRSYAGQLRQRGWI